ncbi:MAG: type I DNA topoisomerase [Holdemanella sp.]|nr:type I DNA topoisomerase [Holdemanella sp.]
MKENLVIVESPSKAKTIEKYLGKDYKVVSSKGHVRDLATTGKGRLGIDIENDFKPNYIISKDKKDVVKELKNLAKSSQHVYLASDPDREGEAIAWHLAEVLGLDMDEDNRIVFNEITKPAILEAIKNPRKIDQDMFASQQARRMVDRIIGFKLSNLLQKKIKCQSAGRVQSVALKLICDREKEISDFIPEEYWTIDIDCIKDKKKFNAELKKVDGKKQDIKNEQEANALIERLGDEYVVESVQSKVKSKQPNMPFITSSLQQTASVQLNMSAKKTMSLAQKLYENGYITYMRTDSYRLSDLFVDSAFQYIEQKYGKKYVGKLRQKKNENAQDAHEAIRPTDITKNPESVSLSRDELRLYKLIYARTISSLMAPSKYDNVTVTISNNGLSFDATGSTLTFDGYLKEYGGYESVKDQLLPELMEKEMLKEVKVNSKQHFTEPKMRYSEARLIKEMEENGIGRPSTYATILDTIQQREYVELKKEKETSKTKVFFPTEQGILANQKLQEYFSSIINVKYTANMETKLDAIADGKIDSVEQLRTFYDKFMPLLEKALKEMDAIKPKKVGRVCPECGSELVLRKGKYGEFVACENYPTCKYIEQKEEDRLEETCPECGSHLVKKMGRFGAFIACGNYPECKYIKKTKKEAEKTGEDCPECGKPLVKRISRYGKPFIACSGFPKCHYIKKEKKEE